MVLVILILLRMSGLTQNSHPNPVPVKGMGANAAMVEKVIRLVLAEGVTRILSP